MDTSDPDIEFDGSGQCNHCRTAETKRASRLATHTDGDFQIDRLVDRIKAAGKGRAYDCVIGVSGGVDSTYVAYIVRKYGLRALAVHFDNGWNSELAVQNIERALRALDIPLHTHVVDWEEFRDLQLAFLKASVPDAEVPTDHAIGALLYRMAAKYGVRYIMSGTNVNTESILPLSWTWYVSDWKYIKAIHRIFGTRPLRTYPSAGLFRYVFDTLVRRIRSVSILNSVPYDKVAAVGVLERELGWRNYGGKHHESIYTRFFQSYILPVKFGIDKRRAHLSSLIVSGQSTREQALSELSEPIADPKLIAEDRVYVAKKFGLTEREFDALMELPPRSVRDYPNDAKTYARMRKVIRVAQNAGLLPRQIGM